MFNHDTIGKESSIWVNEKKDILVDTVTDIINTLTAFSRGGFLLVKCLSSNH